MIGLQEGYKSLRQNTFRQYAKIVVEQIGIKQNIKKHLILYVNVQNVKWNIIAVDSVKRLIGKYLIRKTVLNFKHKGKG